MVVGDDIAVRIDDKAGTQRKTGQFWPRLTLLIVEEAAQQFVKSAEGGSPESASRGEALQLAPKRQPGPRQLRGWRRLQAAAALPPYETSEWPIR